jgi:predicted ATPase
MAKILTPDQRLRVFVSSSMKELREERLAARSAIDELHMMPVMFGLGARAHPPRNLYRAYIEQSHVFVGIYWQEYGWVASGMSISGVEDEYIGSAEMPKLIYIKEPADDRSPELSSLLDRIRNDDRVSYKSFSTAEELKALVSDDLAILLTERFYSAAPQTPASAQENPRSAALPLQPTRFIGRSEEIAQVTSLLQREDVKLVTLVGPGGIGKSRLAIETARGLEAAFEDGLRFIPLAQLTDADRLFTFLVAALELKENTSDPETALANWLATKEVLLILDNFEQLLDAADEVADLLEHSQRSKILVTSRAVLRIRGEHECPVPPLSLPRDVEGRISRSDAIALFKERALEVRPDLVIEGSDVPIVAEICRRLDGLPLAIELGAARMKVLTPRQLLDRLSDRLTLLTGGARDLPERQQTLRATIDWSYQLLNEEERELFARLAVFRRGATLEAIEEVCAPGTDLDVLEGVASLVEKSLLRQELSESGDARFWMLETIREFATELFSELPAANDLRERHAAFYEQLCHQAERGTLGREQRLWLEKVDQDYANVLDASNYIFATDNENGPSRLAKMLWDLVLFAWVRNRLADARRAAELLLEIPDLDDRSRAYALASGGAAAFWQGDIGIAIPMVFEGMGLFEKVGDNRGVGTTLLILGMVAPEMEGPEAAKEKLVHALTLFEDMRDEAWLSIGYAAYCWTLMLMDEFEGLESVYERAVELSKSLGAELTYAMSLGNLGMLRNWQGRHDEALHLQLEALHKLMASGHDGAVTYTLVNSAESLLPLQEAESAAVLLGARDSIHERLNVLDLSLMKKRRERVEEDLRKALGDDGFEGALNRGRLLSPNGAAALLASKVPAAAR